MGQYFDNDPSLESRPSTYRFSLFGEEFTFHSDLGVFSKDRLDDGSKLLLETIGKTDLGTNILDLGAGLGPIGLILAYLDPTRSVTLADVNDRALACCRQNAIDLGVAERCEILHSDVYLNLNKTFSTIVTNPPIRAGKAVTYAMYAGAPSHLIDGGQLILVIRKQQGAESVESYLKTLFPSVSCLAKHKGYRIIVAKR